MSKVLDYIICFGLLVLLALQVSACETKEQELSRSKKESSDRILQLAYFKDPRTNLCFVGYGMGWNFGLMTNVPCSPEVEKLIKE
jgi:hypothetical protein